MNRIIKIIISFLIGAVYLGFFDWLQGKFGTEIYDTSIQSILKIPLEFGILTLIISQLVPWFEKNFEFENIKSSIKETIFELFFYTILYFITLMIFLPSYLIVLLFLFLILSKSSFTYKSGDWKYLFAFGVIGPILECALVHLGTFQYYHNDMFGIPYWLPLLWGNGGLVVRRLFNLPQLKWRI